ncbi:hypothetical protein [Microbacterium gorillae]|uniref:hypothetical protein n=1 Tax=Microbacterium gorillae TaxID=1231063 RepID=UPI00058F415D|nr:hypothetical protein [Microbacterium gorillae]
MADSSQTSSPARRRIIAIGWTLVVIVLVAVLMFPLMQVGNCTDGATSGSCETLTTSAVGIPTSMTAWLVTTGIAVVALWIGLLTRGPRATH